MSETAARDLVSAIDGALGPTALIEALEALARNESGRPAGRTPRVALTRLERLGPLGGSEADREPRAVDVGDLTERQHDMLRALRDAPSVAAAAEQLGTSRSNAYASLRRISRKLDVGSVQVLLDLLRTDRLTR